VLPFSDFLQIDPRHGQPATQRTEAWLSFDDDIVYVSVRCFESPPERMVANELRRDHVIIYNNNDDERPLWGAGRAARGRSELQPRGRIRSSSRQGQEIRAAPLQPT
jgi:hypothetical protein